MNLRVLLPERVFLDVEAEKVTAEARNGCFCLLPRHVDFVAALVPGLLAYAGPGGQEEFLAIDEGLLVKSGDEILVSTRNAVAGLEVGELKERIREEFEIVDERERTTRSAVARLEADLVRSFMELDRRGR